MKNEKQVTDPRKQRKLLLLPLIVIPFLTMAFWALGGGKTGDPILRKRSRLNLQLPNAQLKDDKGENKLSYYEEAERDSLKWRESISNDPFYPAVYDSLPDRKVGYNPYPLQRGEYKDPNEQKVYQKLAELNTHLQNPAGYDSYNPKQNLAVSSDAGFSFRKEDVDRLEQMIKATGSPTGKDLEVEQLNGIMDRILDIQHPERVKQKLTDGKTYKKEEVLEVGTGFDHFSVSLIGAKVAADPVNDFYGVTTSETVNRQNAFEAVIQETQNLVDGSIVKMCLTADIAVGGTIISQGNFVFGKATLQGERLHIAVNSIRKDNFLFPVDLVVYDLDGLEGIHVPGAITRDVAKQSADHSLQNIEMSSIDPSLKAQAAAAGINTARNLFSKKVKLVKVTVKAGYKILLKEKNQP